MDLRNSLEGIPILSTDSMDINLIEKICNNDVADPDWSEDNLVTSSTFDNSKKNKFLFLTVEYIDDHGRDYGKIYPTFDQSFSSRASSPMSDYDSRVSPHDPNMSSAARYSPTPVALSPSLFHESAIILSESTNTVISPSDSSNQKNNYGTELIDQVSTGNICQSEDSSDFTDSEGLVSSVKSELMLMSDNEDCLDNEDYALSDICTIYDQPVPSRAIATLPHQYLRINKLPLSKISRDLLEYGVFAKQTVRQRTKFGPIEGILKPYDGSLIKGLPLLFKVSNENEFLQIDVSDENSSNWMRFVRPAETYKEQNLIICQQNDGIIFLTTKIILAGEELKAGPSYEYAKTRNIEVLNSKDKISQDFEISGKINHIEDNVKINNKSQTASLENLQKYSEVIKYLNADLKNMNSTKLQQNNFKKSVKFIDSIILDEENIKKEIRNQSEDDTQEIMQHEVTQSCKILEAENNNGTDIYKCSVCSSNFTSKLKFQQHCLIHNVTKPDSLVCKVCSKMFYNNSSLTRHLKIHQKSQASFQCLACKETFDCISKLKDFSESDSNQDEIFTCPHCPKTFTNYILLRKHARGHHVDRKHECEFCFKTFTASDKLKMHLLSHSDKRDFQCANCNKQFKRKDKLKEHVTRVHYAQKPIENQLLNDCAKKIIPKVNQVDCERFVYKCRRCQIGFKRRGMLVNHLAKRHPDVPPESVPELSLPILRQTRDYYCQYCDKVYKSSSKRKAHIIKNHPGAALPPSNRSKDIDYLGLPNPTFSQAAGSIKTIPQGCQWCHKQYASKAKLLQHQRKKHPHLMEPADQIPRPRSRPPQNQNQPPISSNVTANNSNNIKVYDKIIEVNKLNNEIIKLKTIKPNNGIDEIPVTSKFEGLSPQLTRVRDVR